MKSKTKPITLSAIAKLIDQKLGNNSQAIFARFDSSDKKILGIYGELDVLKHQQLVTDNKIDDLRQEMDQDFKGVYDGLSQLAETIDKDLQPRVKRLEDKLGISSAN